MSRRRARRAKTVVVRRRAAPRAVVKTRTRYVRVRRAGRRALGAVSAKKEKIGIGIAAAVWGYIKGKNPTMLEKVPAVAGIPKELLVGGALTMLMKPRRGSWFDHATTAMIAIGAHNWGNAQATGASVQGDGDEMGDMD